MGTRSKPLGRNQECQGKEQTARKRLENFEKMIENMKTDSKPLDMNYNISQRSKPLESD